DPILAVRQFLSRPALARGRKRLIVACSGGADSVALLQAAASACPAMGWELAVLHCQHGLRGRESEADAALVASHCADLDLPLRLFETRLGRGAGVEERARDWRRQCYAKAAAETGSNLVLLAHHARDQAETLLLNLVRGSGPAGAAGMLALAPLRPGAGPRLGRPFLGLDPVSLRRWLKHRSLAWREDASNLDQRLARNRIRLSVLPLLESINPKAVMHLAAYSQGLGTAKRAASLEQGLGLDRSARSRVSGLLARGRGSTDLGHGKRLEVSNGSARIWMANAEIQSLNVGAYEWGPGWRFSLKPGVPNARKLKQGRSFWFSLDLLKAAPRWRACGDGQRMRPFGLDGSRLCRDLLAEAGVPAWQREAWPLLQTKDGNLALPGVRRGQGYEAKAGENALELRWQAPEGALLDKHSLK
ncbi:MAG TPA: tRNA lysidine(34) synthetase TilS, partial [bacterium]|nr:tRNA lysidine(34) synthetase TilS [bacterium]